MNSALCSSATFSFLYFWVVKDVSVIQILSVYIFSAEMLRSHSHMHARAHNSTSTLDHYKQFNPTTDQAVNSPAKSSGQRNTRGEQTATFLRQPHHRHQEDLCQQILGRTDSFPSSPCQLADEARNRKISPNQWCLESNVLQGDESLAPCHRPDHRVLYDPHKHDDYIQDQACDNGPGC